MQVKLGAMEIAFYDDALLADKEKRFLPLCGELRKRFQGLGFHTPNGLHARFLDADLARRMRRTGFITLRLALETIDPARQVATGGKISRPEFELAIKNLRQAGFTKSEIGVYLMYGLPGQDWEEVRAGAAYLMDLNVRINLTEYSPLPGTPLWNDLVRQGVIPADLDPLLTNNSAFSLRFAGYDPAAVSTLKREATEFNHKE